MCQSKTIQWRKGQGQAEALREMFTATYAELSIFTRRRWIRSINATVKLKSWQLSKPLNTLWLISMVHKSTYTHMLNDSSPTKLGLSITTLVLMTDDDNFHLSCGNLHLFLIERNYCSQKTDNGIADARGSDLDTHPLWPLHKSAWTNRSGIFRSAIHSKTREHAMMTSLPVRDDVWC